MRGSGRLLVVIAAGALAGSGLAAGASGAQARPEIGALVSRVGQRVVAYYRRAQQLVCLERSTVIPIDARWTVLGVSRTVESELRVELDALDGDNMPEAQVSRQVLRINGRQPRTRDKTDRSGCTDPTPVSPEPLAFLLPAHRDEFEFTSLRDGRDGDRAALVIDFRSAKGARRLELIESESGRDDCYSVKGDLAIRGRLWVDAATDDVLRLEEHVAGPTDIRVSWPMQRKHLLAPSVTLDRYDVTLHYKQVPFSDPDETVLLPESSDSMFIYRNDLQSTHRTEVFSGYRRFLTDARLIKGR